MLRGNVKLRLNKSNKRKIQKNIQTGCAEYNPVNWMLDKKRFPQFSVLLLLPDNTSGNTYDRRRLSLTYRPRVKSRDAGRKKKTLNAVLVTGSYN